MATEYILAATMLFGSYASPVERPIEGVFTDPVQCMSHWQAASRRTGMTFLNIEGTVCVERQRGTKASAPASAASTAPATAADRRAYYEAVLGGAQTSLEIYQQRGDKKRAAAVAKDIAEYKKKIAALQ